MLHQWDDGAHADAWGIAPLCAWRAYHLSEIGRRYPDRASPPVGQLYDHIAGTTPGPFCQNRKPIAE